MDRPANDLSGTRLPVVMARTRSGRLTSSRRIGRRTWRPVKGLTSWRMTAGRLTGIAGLRASAPRALVWTGSIDRWCNHRRDVSRRIRRRQVSRRRRRRARPAWAIALGRRRQRPIGTGHDLEAAVARLLVGNNHGRQPVDHGWRHQSRPPQAKFALDHGPQHIDAVLEHGNVGTARDGGPKLRERRRGAHRDEQGRIADTHGKPVSGGGECNGGVRENSFKTGANRR